jgi:ATP-dependent DNA helicase RecQ
LTATATPDVAADICREFKIGRDAYVHTGFYRPNLVLRITPCRPGDKSALLLRRLKERPRGPTIVYVTLQRTAEEVADQLARTGLPARAYHAGMESEDRDTVQDWFMEAHNAIVVATIAFGMGIDKANIRYVYHYNLPKSLENYSQEIGRAGRDGKESTCEILASGEDVIVLENFTYGDTPEPANVAAMVDSILRNDGDFDVSTYDLSRTHDMRPLVISTLLTYLELADIIEATAPFYSEYQFASLKSSKEILARFDSERADFLGKVLANSTKAKKWFHIDVDATANKLEVTRDRIVKAFTYLEEQGDLTLKVAGLRQGYRIKNRPADADALKKSLVERFETRERNDIARVRQVVSLADHTGCTVRQLLSYFGEDLGRNCGHCESCLGKPRAPVALPSNTRAPALNREDLRALIREYPKALGTPRQVARFLCGLASPKLTQSKLSRHRLFGTLAETPFHAVMDAVNEI